MDYHERGIRHSTNVADLNLLAASSHSNPGIMSHCACSTSVSFTYRFKEEIKNATYLDHFLTFYMITTVNCVKLCRFINSVSNFNYQGSQIIIYISNLWKVNYPSDQNYNKVYTYVLNSSNCVKINV